MEQAAAVVAATVIGWRSLLPPYHNRQHGQRLVQKPAAASGNPL